MLVGLSIRNVVLIETLSLSFAPGLCALTGETGAGKSILLDALGLALGGRAEAGLVRHGAPSAAVTAEFELAADHPAHGLLAAHELEPAPTLVLRRSLGADGRSRAFVNDQAVSVGLLRQIGETLVEVHGQFEAQGLLNPQTHRDLLDAYGGLGALAGAAAAAWATWREAEARRGEAEAEAVRARAEEDYLRHAAGELDALDPRPGEEAEVAERRAMLMHREKLLEAIEAALGELGGGAERALGAGQRSLARVADKAGGRLGPVIEALDRALAELSEATGQLQRLSADVDLDTGELERLEERLFALRAAARKYGVDVDGLAQRRDELTARLALLEDQTGAVSRLTQQAAAARAAYLQAAAALSEARRSAAAGLDEAVAVELPPLKLEKARFATAVEPLAEADWGPAGQDRVTFRVATNPGTPPGPLNRIASGGELARFMLALKVVLARTSPVPTLVFDEVDAGISGAVADAVGERLARLAEDLQVLVVTHSPQVAARAAHHWRVQKVAAGDGVVTTAVELAEPMRREEIARMLSGATVTDQARAAADSLMARRA